MARQEITLSEKNNLRVGDVVRIHLYMYGDEPLGQPFEAEIVKLERDANYDHQGVCRPIIHWEPRPEIDYRELGGVSEPSAFCDSAYITNVVRKARCNHRPYSSNLIYQPHREFGVYSNTPRSKTCVATSASELAKHFLSRMPDAHIPHGLNEDKIEALWEQDGKPGFRGYYYYFTQKVSQLAPSPDTGNGFTFGNLSRPWLHKKQFRKWLLRRLPHLITTEAEMRESAKKAYEDDKRAYERDFSDW